MRKKVNKLNTLRLIAAIAVVTLTVFAAVFISARTVGNVAVSNVTDGFRKFFSLPGGKKFPYTVDSLGVKEIRKFGGDILVLCDDSYFVISSSGRENDKIQLPSADTRVAVSNGRALVYDIRKGTVKLLSKTESLADVSVGHAIQTAALGKNGSFAVARADEEVLCMVDVYGTSQAIKYSWKIKTERVSSIAFSDDCRQIAIACVGSDNAETYSRVIVLDIGSEEPVKDIRIKDTVVLGVGYSAENDIFVVGDNRYQVYNGDFEVTAEEEYAENSLAAFELSERNGAVIAVSEFGGSKTSVVRFDSKGKLLFKNTVDGEADRVCADGRKTAVIVGNTAVVLNRNGEQSKSFEFDAQPSSVVFLSGSFFNLEENRIVKY